jgi:hypothetical protein
VNIFTLDKEYIYLRVYRVTLGNIHFEMLKMCMQDHPQHLPQSHRSLRTAKRSTGGPFHLLFFTSYFPQPYLRVHIQEAALFHSVRLIPHGTTAVTFDGAAGFPACSAQ